MNPSSRTENDATKLLREAFPFISQGSRMEDARDWCARAEKVIRGDEVLQRDIAQQHKGEVLAAADAVSDSLTPQGDAEARLQAAKEAIYARFDGYWPNQSESRRIAVAIEAVAARPQHLSGGPKNG